MCMHASQVLSNHMISGVYSYDDLIESATEAGLSGFMLQTVNGETLKLTTDGYTLWGIPEGSDASIAASSVIRRDVESCAGLMHVLDGVLAPAGTKIAGTVPPPSLRLLSRFQILFTFNMAYIASVHD